MKKIMKITLVLIFVCLWLSTVAFAQPKLNVPGDKVRVLIQTELGDIEIEVNSKAAPVTAANFWSIPQPVTCNSPPMWWGWRMAGSS